MKRRRLRRMWINQPSSLQQYHKFHGRRVIYDPDNEEVWFTEGNITSQQINPLALSPDWPEHLQPHDT